MSEYWRVIEGYEGLYEVSDLGRVRSFSRFDRASGRILKVTIRNGYDSVRLTRDGCERSFYVHRLVAAAFCQRKPGCRVVRHLDGGKSNNVPANLAWGTHSDNSIDAVIHGANYLANRTHCKHGHEYTPANTLVRMRKGRVNRNCRACSYASGRRRSEARRAAKS